MSNEPDNHRPANPAVSDGERNPPTGRVRIPEHVVHREFPNETVILNLETEQYHGLNATGGRIFEALERLGDVGAAAAEVASVYREPQEKVERDVAALCGKLAERGLIELDGG